MTFAEKKLYHQIHPVKLTVDILSAFISLYFFWFHFLLIALSIHFLFPIFASFGMMTFVSLDKQKNSTFGRYIKKYMTSMIEAIRLIGDIVMIFGAWYQSWIIIIAGLCLIVLAWFNGKLKINDS